MGHSDSKLAQAPQITTEGADKGIPRVIRALYENSWSQLICFSRISLYLSEPDSEPSYSVSFPRGWYGDVVLHNGPDTESAPLARAEKDGSCRVDYSVSLPAMPDSNSGGSLEILRYPTGKKGRWWFAMEVGQRPDRHVERFEWRRSRGSEVKSIGQSRRGWKLVRLGSSKYEEYSSDGEVADERDGFTSDGKEVVAVWASSKTFTTLSGVGELQFRGSGATGELGTLWALMTVMS
ncbi:hypothetical protein FZEAL_10934, partial [Fusarium zealandicum]